MIFSFFLFESIIPNRSAKFILVFSFVLKCKTISIGNKYSILEVNGDQIKIKNNSGIKKWYSVNRFLYSIKIEDIIN